MKAFHFDNFLGQSEKSLLGFAVLKCFLANSSRFFCDSYVEWLLSLDFWQSHHRLWMQCCSPFWRIAVKKHSQRLFLLSFKGWSCNWFLVLDTLSVRSFRLSINHIAPFWTSSTLWISLLVEGLYTTCIFEYRSA